MFVCCDNWFKYIRLPKILVHSLLSFFYMRLIVRVFFLHNPSIPDVNTCGICMQHVIGRTGSHWVISVITIISGLLICHSVRIHWLEIYRLCVCPCCAIVPIAGSVYETFLPTLSFKSNGSHSEHIYKRLLVSYWIHSVLKHDKQVLLGFCLGFLGHL